MIQLSMAMKVLTVLVLTLTLSQCSRILSVLPMPSKSHYILSIGLMRELAERGHDVTVISAYQEKNPPKNGTFRSIEVSEMIEHHKNMQDGVNMFDLSEINPFLTIPMFMDFGPEATLPLLDNPKVQDLLKSDEKFDVVIVEQFLNEVHKGFASHFKAPLISVSTLGANTWVNILSGNPSPSSYIPDIFMNYPSQMSFWERCSNFLFQAILQTMYHLYAFPKHKKIYEKYFPNEAPFYDVLYNSSIFLLNSHPSINQPVPLVPNMIEIGGFHIQPPKKLPDDLQKFLDEAPEGVIYFSMGSNLLSKDLPVQKRDAFLQAFSKLKQKVLWKWEDDNLPGKPQNVKIGKWLPQQDILAHPNVKLFITHGGLLSTSETVYHGVPVIAIPIYGDQKFNTRRIASAGFGLSLSFDDITEEALTEKLTEVLTNPKYTENAKMRSRLFHDRPTSPMETAVYWVEYVIRHQGAPHLKVAAVDLPLYKYFLLDVLAFLVMLPYAIFKVMKCLCSFKRGKGKLKQN